MDKKTNMEKLADYYDNTDTSHLMADAVLETDTVPLSDVWRTRCRRASPPTLTDSSPESGSATPPPA
jgi:hypothetical protein